MLRGSHPAIGNYLVMTTGQILTKDDAPDARASRLGRQRGAQALGCRQDIESLRRINPVRRLSGGDATGPNGGQFYSRHLPLRYMTYVQNSAVPGQQCFAELLVHYAEQIQ